MSLYWQRHVLGDAGLIYIPYPAYLDLIFLRIICPKKHRPRIAIDAFLCLHDTVVNDRKLVKPDSLAARMLLSLEAGTMQRADLIFIDTEQQKQQLVASYDLDENKLFVTPVGIDENIWKPLPTLPLKDDFNLVFWGTFIPLHGIETIIKSAEQLAKDHPNIKFTLIGNGQTADSIASKLNLTHLDNITWMRELVETEVIRSHVERAHCILGIFGGSRKAGNVIPYKVYQAMASNRIVITRNGPAFSELLRRQSDIPGLILIEPDSPQALAEAILATVDNYTSIIDKVDTRSAYDATLSTRYLEACVENGVKGLLS